MPTLKVDAVGRFAGDEVPLHLLADRPGIATRREIDELAGRFATECGMDEGEMLVKALVLFREVFRSHERGLRVAILDEDDEIVQEIGGIETPIPTGQVIPH